MHTATHRRHAPLASALIALGLGLAAPAARAAQCPTRAAWPTAGWTDRTQEIAAMKAEEIRALEQYAFTLTGADTDRIGIRTDAVVVIHQGSVFYEHYARGYNADMPHYAWSVTKTITNALTGIAVGHGFVNLDDTVCRYTTLSSADHCAMTLRNVLEFGTGFAWTESYENQSNQVSSVLAMLYGEGHQDMLSFVGGHDLRDAPGSTYMYSTGDATFLMGLVNHAYRNNGMDENYPWTLLFDPIGMQSAVFERDTSGTFVGGSWFYATPRDYAKFGFLYLNDGCWESGRILPENWVADSTAVSPEFLMRRLDTDPGDEQGRMIWLNHAVPQLDMPQPWPDVPEDAFAARGHWGQSITVIPSLDLVIVRLADDRDTTALDFNRFLSLAIALVR